MVSGPPLGGLFGLAHAPAPACLDSRPEKDLGPLHRAPHLSIPRTPGHCSAKDRLMARRSVLLIVAVLIALVGTSLIVLYVQGIDSRATAGQELVEVLVADRHHRSGRRRSPPPRRRASSRSPRSAARTSSRALSRPPARSRTWSRSARSTRASRSSPRSSATSATPAPSSSPTTRWPSRSSSPTPERVAGFVNPGSEVAIFVVGRPGPLQAGRQGTEARRSTPGSLLPKVEVVGVGTTSIAAKTTKSDEGEETEQVARTILTVAVDQERGREAHLRRPQRRHLLRPADRRLEGRGQRRRHARGHHARRSSGTSQ